ncbi:polysaccharide deacetylase family protein [Hyphomonas sp.]|uniref:polysaccharide deacetylase family protein n=1 Tax=Hyphomonas sp. TaxID=87 RepID=UPI0035281BF9
MPLPDEYLTYDARKHGMDNDRYGWDPADRRSPMALASGAKAAALLIVPAEFFPLNPPAEPFKHPGAMKTPYPDLRHFTVRDYGNRVGIFRILKELAAEGLHATFVVNAEVARRYSPLMDAIREGGHEIAAHGVSTAHIHHDGLSEADERALIADTRATFPDATTWMSPARNESYRTPDLLTEAGFKTCLDWEADNRPLPLATAHGALVALPNYNELSDFKLMADRQQSPDEWADQVLEAARYCVADYERSGAQALGFTLTPYIAGQPFRIRALRRILAGLAAMDGLDILTAREMADAFKKAAK